MYKRTVLIVDDQMINRKVLENMLKNEYKLLSAENGKDALVKLKKDPEMISAVVLDIMMPEMNGYQVLEEMAKDEKLSHIPVIVSSQREGDDEQIKALSLGAQDYIAKPYKIDLIRHKLSNLIRLRETSLTINRIQKDPVTGLLNREYFFSKARDVLKANQDVDYDILFIGVERFKIVNDVYGRVKGNEVLSYLAGIIQEASRPGDLCARFTADQFYVLCEHREYTKETFEPWVKKSTDCPVELEIKIHCGIYKVSKEEIEIETMCDWAKMAGDANRGEYNRYFTYYDDSLRKRMLQEQFIISEMHTAITERQFQVYFQPKYNLDSELMAGAEALVRWIHPVRGFMSPGEFVPIFERNGFITALDVFVWEETCRCLREWKDHGYPIIPVSVNVSRADLFNPHLQHILLSLVAKYEIPMRYLHLEITESAYTENPKQIIERVNQLRDAGFVIEMDDFGTGYSSLNMLAEMPVDILKLDMRFMQTESKESSGKGIIGFIISLAKWLGLSVVAEGVEDREQIEMLRSMDCDYVQGYYYDKPMPSDAFAEKLSNATVMEMAGKHLFQEHDILKRDVKNAKTDGAVMLIVDDIEDNRAVLASAFQQEYMIVEKEDGLEAWKYLQEHYDEVEVIMLDLLMPVMDGFQLLEKIRNDEAMWRLPVLVTSQGTLNSEHRALELQANDYISKPYDLDVIAHRVQNVVGNYKLSLLQEGIISEKVFKDQMIKNQTKPDSISDRILEQVKALEENFDIVRLVDPTRTKVFNDAEHNCNECYEVWGKTARCSNCTSLRAYEHKTKVSKLEYTQEGLYYVLSQFVPYGPKGAVLEIVSKIDDEYIDNVFDKELYYMNLDEVNDKLERDELTGVFNRRHLDVYLEKYIVNARRMGQNLGLAMIDIDHFKELNDTKGHLFGDDALKGVARILQDNISVSKGDFVARFGGDEFVLVCRNISREIFEKRLNAVLQVVEQGTNQKLEGKIIGISGGIVMMNEFSNPMGLDMLKAADKRLYLAKESGRNKIISQ